jgi:hypothetical protein
MTSRQTNTAPSIPTSTFPTGEHLEWLPESTIRRRLRALAKFDQTDIKTGLLVYELIPKLIAAHVANWYDSKPPTNSEGIPVIEWLELLRVVRRMRPDIWPGYPDPEPGTIDRYGEADRAKTALQHARAPRKPGTKPYTFERMMGQMQRDLDTGHYTIERLNELTGKQLVDRYGPSDTTARKARDSVLKNNAAQLGRTR